MGVRFTGKSEQLHSTKENQTKHSVSSEVYPGAPLKAVAIEVEYAPLYDARARIAQFQRDHSDFEISAPPAQQSLFGDGKLGSAAVPTSPLLLLNSASDRALSVSATRLAVVSYEYAGFEKFTGWAMPLLRKALEAIDPPGLRGLKYKYENVIDLPSVDDRGVDLGSMFNIDLPPSPGGTHLLANVHLFWRTLWPSGTTLVSLDCCNDSYFDGTVQLNIAGECGGTVDLARIDVCVQEARMMARATFEHLITDAFRNRIRGGIQ